MELNKETMQNIRRLILFAVAAVILGVNYQKVLAVLGRLFGVAAPFLLGGAMAFVLNVPMRIFEKAITKGKPKKWARPVSLCLTILLVICVIFLVTFVVVPELVRTILGLQKSIQAFFDNITVQVNAFLAANPQLVEMIDVEKVDWQDLGSKLVAFLTSGAGSMLSSTVTVATSILNGLTTFFIGAVFAVYILLQKESLGRQFSNLLKAYLPEKQYQTVIRISALTERIFSSFLAGQCLEAVILGAMFVLTLTLLRLPYALLIGVLIAFTALIPVFGAFIGCMVGAFLMLVVSPLDALIFVVVFLVLQQIEGNLIYPRVVGGSVGLPPIWVLMAVTLGGSLMGVVGMLVFIPGCSVVYALLRENVRQRLGQKQKASASCEQS